MRIFVKVKPNARGNRIEKIGDDQFLIWVKQRPHKNKANQAAIEILAEYFGVAKSCVRLLRGRASRQKQFQI